MSEIEIILKNGFRTVDKFTGATLCIYKEHVSKYYTLVIDEEVDQITIITGYESSKWQIEKYRKVIKNEH